MVDFTINVKQGELVNCVLSAVSGGNPYREIAYGGAIRGGKTYGTLGCLVLLCAMYPGSKWAVIRGDSVKLKETTIPSMERILSGSPNWKWNRGTPYYCEYIPTKSKILFLSENLTQDPELTGFLGLEINGALLEQAEELSLKCYEMVKSRLGSLYIPKMPRPLLLFTFNPCQNWVKDMFYIPYKKGLLEAPRYFISAIPSDNPMVTKEQWEMWDTLDPRYKKQFIDGDWADLRPSNELWSWAFDKKKHCYGEDGSPLKIEPDKNQFLYLSFDFNRNPISCIVAQHIFPGTCNILETIKLENSDIYKLCTKIKETYPGFIYIVTGDASGRSSSAMVKDNMNYYKIIQMELRVNNAQFNVPSANPKLAENQVLVNSVLSKGNIKIDLEKNYQLIFDLENCRMNADGTIVKTDRNDPTQQADALDCLRYYINTFHRNFVKIKIEI